MPIMLLESSRTPGKPTAPVPRFGPSCVCCNGDARGRLVHHFVGGERYLVRGGFEIPVCVDCDDHALRTQGHDAGRALLIGLGLITALLAIAYHRERSDRYTIPAFAIGVVVLALGLAWQMVVSRREKRVRRREGHHPYAFMWVMRDATFLRTDNMQLVEELGRLNPGARFRETRAERKRVPHARVISAAAAPEPADPAAANRAVALITKNTTESLAAARAMIEGGEVSALIVAHQLAELEAVLGRRDLVARLDALGTPPGS